MNFQSLPLPLSKFTESRDLLRPVRLCGCNCIDACKCACSCRDHCACEARCNGTCTAHLTRNLVVCLDDVVTELGEQNTNVLELYSRILVDPDQNQLTHYGCSSGIYTSNHEGRIKHWFQHVENAVERAIGWNSKKALLKAYLWICEHYKPGDKIFLFGFSRGAYEVQALAAMIDKVGLVNAGNEELVPLAYDVFLEAQRSRANAIREAEIFKRTFARNIRIHFVGAWDTVSCSKILGKSGLLPTSAEHACIFRHALALDEYRVKMIPAIAHPPPPQIHDKEKDDASSTETKISSGITIGKRTQIFQETGPVTVNVPNIKEVWFPGRHVDMGGGMKSDAVLSSVPLLWMENEATSAGLRLQSRKCQRARGLREGGDVPKLSSSPVQRLLDLPFVQRASFNLGSTRSPPAGKSRIIYPGQLIHASVAFMPKEYRPMAVFKNRGLGWENLVGQDIERRDFDWVSRHGDLLEMNLFDQSFMVTAVEHLNDAWYGDEHSGEESYWLGRLSFMALSGNLSVACLSSSEPVWNEDPEIELASAVKFFQRLADQQPVIFGGDLAEVREAQGRLSHLRGKGNPEKLFDDALDIRRASGKMLGKYKLAATLAWLGSYALVIRKPQKALSLFDESVAIVRSLLADKYFPAIPLLAFLQRNFTTYLKNFSNSDTNTALRVVEIIVTLSRNLAQSYPQYTPVLAAALHDRAFGFPANLSLDSRAAEESISLYRNLANRNPEEYGASFADALYNSSGRLFSLGQYEGALSASLEEARIRRRFKGMNNLATCLDQLSRCLSTTGKMDEALNAAEEVVRIRRKLSEDSTAGEFESQLADSLNNLSCCLSLKPRGTRDALEAAREAVSIQRGLVRESPAGIFTLRLAIFLHNFSVGLSGTGRHEEALRVAEEALKTQISRGDDSSRALALSRVASCLRAVGKVEEALKIAEDCLGVVRRLMIIATSHKFGTERTETQFAEALFAISFCFPAKEAVQVAMDSVAIYRKVTKSLSSPAVSTCFARALLQLSTLLSSIGKDDEGLRSAVEAAQIGCGLAKDCYSACLYRLSLCLHTVGNSEEGMDSAQRCVELRRELVKEYETWDFKEKLADALFNLSLYSLPPAAVPIIREAIELQRELADHLPSQSSSKRLSDGLQNLAAKALLAGQAEEALCSAEEAVCLTRKLVESNPAEDTPSLVNVLYTYANILCEYSRYQEGYIAIVDADVLRLGISSESPFASLEASAAYMSTRARCLIGLGQQESGSCGILDAIRLYRKILDDENAPFASAFESFPWFLKNVFACIAGLDKADMEVTKAIAEVAHLSQLLKGYYPERFNHWQCSLRESLELYASDLHQNG